MTVLGVVRQQNLLVLDGTDLPAGVGPDLSAAHVEGQDEQAAGHLRPQVEAGAVWIQGPDQREHDHHQLEQSHGHDHEVDGRGVNLLVYLTPVVSKG